MADSGDICSTVLVSNLTCDAYNLTTASIYLRSGHPNNILKTKC